MGKRRATAHRGCRIGGRIRSSRGYCKLQLRAAREFQALSRERAKRGQRLLRNVKVGLDSLSLTLSDIELTRVLARNSSIGVQLTGERCFNTCLYVAAQNPGNCSGNDHDVQKTSGSHHDAGAKRGLSQLQPNR